MNWIAENQEWIFSGIGATIVGIVITIIISRNKKSPSNKMSQKGGNKSTNIQIGGDYKNGR